MKFETDGSNHLRLRGTDKHGGAVLEPIRRSRTNDSAARTCDTLIDAPTAAEMLCYLREFRINLGKVWDGNAHEAKGVLDRLSDSELRETLTGLEEYANFRAGGRALGSSEMAPGAAGALTFSRKVTQDDAAVRAALRTSAKNTARIAQIQESNDRFWNITKPAS